MKTVDKIPTFYILLGILAINAAMLWAIKTVLLTDAFYYKNLSDQLTTEQISNMISFQYRYQWVAYAITILMTLIKFFFLTVVVQIGLFFWGNTVSFSKILRAVILAEFVFIIPLIIKLAWFYFVKHDFSYKELSYFSPLSTLSLIGWQNVSNIWIYPLQFLNVFEIFYWFALAYFINRIIAIEYDKSVKIVLTSYIPAMLVWIVVIVFITVSLNP